MLMHVAAGAPVASVTSYCCLAAAASAVSSSGFCMVSTVLVVTACAGSITAAGSRRRLRVRCVLLVVQHQFGRPVLVDCTRAG